MCCVLSLHNQDGLLQILCKDTMRGEEKLFGKCFMFPWETLHLIAKNTKVLRGNTKFCERMQSLSGDCKHFASERKVSSNLQFSLPSHFFTPPCLLLGLRGTLRDYISQFWDKKSELWKKKKKTSPFLSQFWLYFLQLRIYNLQFWLYNTQWQIYILSYYSDITRKKSFARCKLTIVREKKSYLWDKKSQSF